MGKTEFQIFLSSCSSLMDRYGCPCPEKIFIPCHFPKINISCMIRTEIIGHREAGPGKGMGMELVKLKELTGIFESYNVKQTDCKGQHELFAQPKERRKNERV
jgi:hypothetical protein